MMMCLSLLSSCTADPLNYQGPNRGNGHRGESGVYDPSRYGTIKPRGDADGDHLYLCGVRYPDGYDWQKDPQKGSVECTLFVLRDGERVLELPVGVSYNLASDSDMHRLIAGRLYTEYSTDTETILACNGEECYRVTGRERLRGLVLKNNDLYTLCESRTSDHWILRRDGAVYLEGDGTILHDLAVNDGTLDGRPTTSGMTEPQLFFVTMSGRTLTLWVDAKEKTSCELPADRRAYLAGLMGEQFWCVFENGSQTGLKNVTHNTLLTIPTRDQVVFSGYAGGGYALCNTGSSLVLYYMHPSAETIHTGSPDTPYALCANPSATSYRDAWAYLARDKGKSTWSIYTNERHISLPEGLVPYSRTHFAYLSGSLILSLQQPGDANSGSGGSASGSGSSGAASGSGAVSGAGSPVLYYNDQFTRYRFNGYIDGWSYGK
ncbi:MAG: hypothetical protein IJR34_05780 [Bacteroidales bacterium]|nr:hypothetical protein [Bacteroidales bacterium]